MFGAGGGDRRGGLASSFAVTGGTTRGGTRAGVVAGVLGGVWAFRGSTCGGGFCSAGRRAGRAAIALGTGLAGGGASNVIFQSLFGPCSSRSAGGRVSNQRNALASSAWISKLAPKQARRRLFSPEDARRSTNSGVVSTLRLRSPPPPGDTLNRDSSDPCKLAPVSLQT
jgi:hypothetical protein